MEKIWDVNDTANGDYGIRQRCRGKKIAHGSESSKSTQLTTSSTYAQEALDDPIKAAMQEPSEFT